MVMRLTRSACCGRGAAVFFLSSRSRVALIGASLLSLVTAPGFAFIPVSGVPWTNTALGSRTLNGQAITLTWGFVGDGTTINDGASNLGGSDLISTFNTAFSGNPAQTDLTQQPWFGFFDDTFNRLSELSGLTYVYEPNDSGQALPSVSGFPGVRPDIRIGGASIDGSSGTLAFNFFPSIGDMVLDTDDSAFFSNAGGSHVRLRNTIAHEAGHGLGLNHVESNTDALLLEPFISASFDGPQLDDIRGIQFFYGDRYEKTNNQQGNNTANNATPLGALTNGNTLSLGVDADVPNQRIEPDAIDFVSIANLSDTDYFSFSIAQAGTLSADLTPLGGQFNQASQGATPTPFDASARADLRFSIWDTDGVTLLASINDTLAGSLETLSGLELDEAGTYFVSIASLTDTIQFYRLDLAIEAAVQLIGDYDGDGFVSQGDLDLVLLNWGDAIAPAGFDEAALASGGPFDGLISQNELDGVLLNWGNGTAPALTAIPEPASGILLLLGITTITRRRSHTHA